MMIDERRAEEIALRTVLPAGKTLPHLDRLHASVHRTSGGWFVSFPIRGDRKVAAMLVLVDGGSGETLTEDLRPMLSAVREVERRRDHAAMQTMLHRPSSRVAASRALVRCRTEATEKIVRAIALTRGRSDLRSDLIAALGDYGDFSAELLLRACAADGDPLHWEAVAALEVLVKRREQAATMAPP